MFTSGAHTPRREIPGSKYPRKYISSTTGPAIPFTTNPKIHVMSKAAVEYREKSSAHERAYARVLFVPGAAVAA